MVRSLLNILLSIMENHNIHCTSSVRGECAPLVIYLKKFGIYDNI